MSLINLPQDPHPMS